MWWILLNWVGYGAYVFVLIIGACKIASCTFHPNYSHDDFKRASNRAELRIVGLMVIAFVAHCLLAHGLLWGLLSLPLWAVLIFMQIREAQKKTWPAPLKGGGITHWFYICWSRCRLVGIEEIGPRYWWSMGCFYPAILVRHHVIRIGQRKWELEARYVVTGETLPINLRDIADADFESLAKYAENELRRKNPSLKRIRKYVPCRAEMSLFGGITRKVKIKTK